MKTCLILEGGAMRGMYTSGVLDVLLENNLHVDGIIGVSAGALFGINYCSKQIGRALRYNKKYINDKSVDYMSFKNLIKTGNLINKDFAFNELPFKLDVFDEKTFRKSKTDFYATITNVKTGKAEYVKIENTEKQMEVFRATGAMPFVSQMVEIDNELYLDGALGDSIPIEKAKDLGYDKLIVVLTRTLNYKKKKPLQMLAKIKYKEYPNLIEAINTRYQKYNDTIEKIIDLENKKEIIVVRPTKDLKIKRIERNTDKLQEMYDLGVSDCKELLPNIKSFLSGEVEVYGKKRIQKNSQKRK